MIQAFFVNSVVNVPGARSLLVGRIEFGTFTAGQSVNVFDKKREFLGEGALAAIFEPRAGTRPEPVDEMGSGQDAALRISGIGATVLRKAHRVVAAGGGPVDLEDVSTYLWSPGEARRVGLSLQGGGMKGAFGVGALTLLAQANLLGPNTLTKISSASTGSLSSIAIATGQGATSAAQARQNYLKIGKPEDLFTLRFAVTELMKESPTIRILINGVLRGEEMSLGTIRGAFKDELDPYWWASMSAAGGSGAGVVATATVGSAAGIVLAGLVGAALMGKSLEDEAEEFAERLERLMSVKPSLATLGPVKKKLMALDGIERLATGPIPLRMAVVDYETGVTAYITEQCELLYPTKTIDSEGFDVSQHARHRIERIGKFGFNPAAATTNPTPAQKRQLFPELLVNGALASAAFPGLFEPLVVTFVNDEGERFRRVFCDGGIRENIPLRILIGDHVAGEESGSESGDVDVILALYCSPLESTQRKLKPRSNSPDPARTPWIDVALRASELVQDEVGRTDATVGRPLNRSALGPVTEAHPEVIHIAPETPPLGLTEVDKRLTAIAIWYGYMRAYDELWITQFQLNDQEREMIRHNTDQIFHALRRVVWAGSQLIRRAKFHDTKLLDEWVTFKELCEDPDDFKINKVAVRASALRTYREAKSNLLAVLVTRFKTLKKHSLPFNYDVKEGTAFLTRKYYSNWSFLGDPLWRIRDPKVRRVVNREFGRFDPFEAALVLTDDEPKRERTPTVENSGLGVVPELLENWPFPKPGEPGDGS